MELKSPTEDKNFYLLAMIDRTPELRKAILADQALTRAAEEHLASLDNAVKSCKTDSACYASALEWTDAQSAEAADALANLYKTSTPIRGFVDGPLKQSGMYVRLNSQPGDELLRQAWLECIHGVNRMIEVYGLGKAPRYPAIDSMTYEAKSENWHNVVLNLAATLEDDRGNLRLFFDPALRFALELMFLNHRDEAGRFEPMEAGENLAAFHKVKSIDWSKYPYSVIVVPGAGNDRAGVRLSAGGKLRDEIAAKRYRDGQAPFILVSGGFVHPERTEYSEAIEMKRDLMTRFGIPADAILVDPHARHTTTNMRNAARLIYRYGLPFDKKGLVSTDGNQSRYIEDANFDKRCRDELGYVPYHDLKRTSAFDLEFLPAIESLHIDPADPLDP